MEIIIKRGFTTTLDQLPEFSIALDGVVLSPQIDVEHHRFSFDHHSQANSTNGCLRFATFATCVQTWSAILLGLNNLQDYKVFLNDIDLDTALSVYCLQNVEKCSDPLIKKLIEGEGYLDSHCGSFPFPNNGLAKIIEWIAAPETDSKRSGDYEKLSETGLMSILEAVIHRIDLYSEGEISAEVTKMQKHTDYKVLRNENNWALIESADSHIYSTLYHNGFDRLCIIRHLEDKSTAVSIAKRSDFIDGFPLQKIYDALNLLEPGWGGSSSCGGAPRNSDGSRSRLPINTIISTIDAVIEKK